MNKTNLTVSVTDVPFCAAGNGIKNDREAIQSAIDYVSAQGGGTVVLAAGKVFLSGGIILKSGVTLLFGDGAVLQQSPDNTHYVKPAQGGGYTPYVPVYGHNFSEKIKWSHCWYINYPLIFAPEGSHDFKICGNGTVRMMDVSDTEKIIKICPIGFYRCSDFEICDVHITNYHSYAMMPFTSERGLIKNVKITDWSHGNGDGICLMNCRDIRITGCEMFTGDDSVYIFSSCRDPRKSEWWSSDEPQPSENIEIDHNDLKSNHCKAFGMILWGLTCPDLEKVEVRNIYVHDNHFETMGNWLYCPYTDKAGNPPVTSVRFENNVIDGIEANFFDTQVSDMNFYRSMTHLENGDFGSGRVFWAMQKNKNPDSAGVCRENGEAYGYIAALGEGDAKLYQGLYMEAGLPKLFRAEVKTTGCKCRIFVRNLDTGELTAHLDFDNTEYCEKTLLFTVPESGNYRIGIERGDAADGKAYIKHAVYGGQPSAFGCGSVIFDNGKIIYKYNDNLFKR